MQGLIRCDLRMMVDDYAAAGVPRQLIGGAKLYTLLELGANFLDLMAPSDSHPAKKQSRMLRTLLAAGTNGQMELNPLVPRNIAPISSNSIPLSDFNSPSLPSSIGGNDDEAGEALANILGGISPSFFGSIYDVNLLGVDLDNGEGMTVDWDSLEKSLLSMEQGGGGGGVDFFP